LAQVLSFYAAHGPYGRLKIIQKCPPNKSSNYQLARLSAYRSDHLHNHEAKGRVTSCGLHESSGPTHAT